MVNLDTKKKILDIKMERKDIFSFLCPLLVKKKKRVMKRGYILKDMFNLSTLHLIYFNYKNIRTKILDIKKSTFLFLLGGFPFWSRKRVMEKGYVLEDWSRWLVLDIFRE